MKSNYLRSTRAVTLTELSVSLAIGAMAVWAIMTIFKYATTATSTAAKQDKSENNVTNINGNLKAKLSGIRSFQNLAFSIGGGNESAGPGFYVEPDTAFDGTASTGNDRLTVVIAVNTASQVRIGAALDLNSATIALSAVDGATPIDTMFKAGDLVAVSTVAQTELVKIVGAPSSTTLPNATFALSAPSFVNTFIMGGGPTALRGSYLQGDLATKAQLVTFGLDSTASKLYVQGGSADPNPHELGSGITSFNVSFSMPAGSTCGTFTYPAATPYYRDAATWTILNTSDSKLCYKKITKSQIQYVQNGASGNVTFNANQ